MYSADTRLVRSNFCCSELRKSAAYNTCGGFAALLEFTGAGPEAFPLRLRNSAAGPGVMRDWQQTHHDCAQGFLSVLASLLLSVE